MSPLEKDAILYVETGKLKKLKACLETGVSPDTAGNGRPLVRMNEMASQPVSRPAHDTLVRHCTLAGSGHAGSCFLDMPTKSERFAIEVRS